MLYTEEAIIKRKNKIHKRKKIIITIVYIILIPLLIYNVTLIIKSILKPNKTPDFFGYKTYVIVSGSMEPSLKIGDIVKGDNNNTEDSGNIDYSYIEGKVFTSIRGLGKVVIFFQGKLSILLIVSFFYLYLSQTNKIHKRKEDRKQKRHEYENKE